MLMARELTVLCLILSPKYSSLPGIQQPLLHGGRKGADSNCWTKVTCVELREQGRGTACTPRG